MGLIFTAGKERGYVLQASHPIGTPAERICVTDRLEAVRLYDARKPGAPKEALSPSSEANATAKCQELSKARIVAEGSCGLLNTMLAREVPFGEGLMMQGQGATKQPDGSYQPSALAITVTANLSGEGDRLGVGAILFTRPEGSTVVATVFTETAYTEAGLQAVASR